MSYAVELYIYDLTQGMASSMAPMLGLNFNLEGVWHTAIVVHGKEWFFGGSGIESCPPGTTMLGRPLRTESMGVTSIDPATFSDYVKGLGQDMYAGHTYDLFKHNCNNFSNHVSNFLCGKQIPQYILDLPEKFLATPLAQMLRPMIEQMTPQNVAGSQSYESTPARTGGAAPSTPSGGPTSAAGGATASAQGSPSKLTTGGYKHFPVREYLGFTSEIDMDKLGVKLEEFNRAKTEEPVRLTGDEISCVKNVEDNSSDWWQKSRKVLRGWSGSETFPVLDLIRWRLAFKPQSVSEDTAKDIYQIITGPRYLGNAGEAPEPGVRLSLRILANMFLASPAVRSIMIGSRESFVGLLNDVVEAVSGIEPESKRQQSEVAAATIALNYARAIASKECTDNAEEATFQLVSALCFTFSQNIRCHEALYRTLAALGTLAVTRPEVKTLAQDLDVTSFLSRVPRNKLDKLDQAVEEAKSVFR